MFKKEDLKDYTLFDPRTDDESKIVNEPGNYVILLQSGSKLPEITSTYSPTTIVYEDKEYEVIYVGISNKALYKRDYKNHFNGNAGKSTLRKSIGSLMGLKKTYRSNGEQRKSSPKTKFIKEDEEILSEWMNDNLLLLYKANPAPDTLETEMIEILNPPLNILKNYNTVNKSYRSLLSTLRNDLSDLKQS